jgi:uncharacterized membrane protein
MSSRLYAFLAYLFGILGSLYVFLARRKDPFAVYHAAQSAALCLFCIGLFIGWSIVNWVLTWIPLVGPVFGAAAFALVIAGLLYALGAWVVGMGNALAREVRPLPIVGRFGERLQGRSLQQVRPPAPEAELHKSSS